jgi:hypothetical protein
MGREDVLRKFRRWSWRQYFPLLSWFPEYKQQLWSNLMHDFVAAIAVTCLIVPQAMSYAILTGVPPINGYGIMGFDRQWSIYAEIFRLSGVYSRTPTETRAGCDCLEESRALAS